MFLFYSLVLYFYLFLFALWQDTERGGSSGSEEEGLVLDGESDVDACDVAGL